MISQEHLKSIVHYDPQTGVFKKIVCRRGDYIGKEAGGLNTKGYRTISVNNKRYLAHRLAWLYVNGKMPMEIDHINGIKSDNRISNLRAATDSQSMYNQGKRKNNKSGYKGVSYHRGAKKWVAQIKINWEGKYLGLYETPEAAYKAYCDAARKYHGEFARLA